MIRRLLALAALLCLVFTGRAEARPLVWVARDADSTITFFGSIHVLPAGLDWQPPELTQALAQADDVWFETPMDSLSLATAGHTAYVKGQLPKGKHLRDLLTPAGRERLDRLVALYGLWPDDIDEMEPWLADVTLSVAALNRQGGTSSAGVEQIIETLAPPGAARRAFETGPQQVDFFHKAPLSEQAALLEQTLAELEDDPGAYNRLLDAWMSGDIPGLLAGGDARLQSASPLLYKRLVTDRNERWTRILMRRLAGHGSTVVVVGAGHLVGPNGVPARLRALGVQVEGP